MKTAIYPIQDSPTKLEMDRAYQQMGLPAGIVMLYAGKVAPRGWLFVDGNARYLKTDYAQLYAVIQGTQWVQFDTGLYFQLNIPETFGDVPLIIKV